MKLKLLALSTLLLASFCAAAVPISRLTNYVPGQRGTVLLFVSSMCPCTDQHKLEVRQLMSVTRSRGVNYYCIFSNIVENDARIGQFYKNIGWEMPYVLDNKGVLAKKFGATRTPQVVVLDAASTPVYRGPIDDSNENLGRIEHAYLRENVMELLEKGTFAFSEIPAIGCWLVITEVAGQ